MAKHRDFSRGGSDFVVSSYVDEEDADPRVGLVNLADVMLVFACGLMLALATYWNVDVSGYTMVTEGSDMIEVDSEELMDIDTNQGGSSYVDIGRVYEDPETGQLYILEGGEEDGE